MSYEEFITFQTYNDKLIDFLKKKRDLFFHVSINKKFNVNESYKKGLEFEISTIDEAYNLSSQNDYKKNGARLGYKNIKRKIFQKEEIKNL